MSLVPSNQWNKHRTGKVLQSESYSVRNGCRARMGFSALIDFPAQPERFYSLPPIRRSA
jgi:hypothetical protein